MPKFFAVSDIHGFYDELRAALDQAGFDENNPDHWLISCGDHFDRGPKPEEVMNYLMSLPRKVLIRGNHEGLFTECCRRRWWKKHDISNGTMDTILTLGFDWDFKRCCINAEKKVRPFFESMVNYFETEHYVFCHAWLPVKVLDNLPAHYRQKRRFAPHPDWRNATEHEWENAMWLNPLNAAQNGLTIDKIVVSGHWHCSYGWARHNKTFDEFGTSANFEPFFFEDKLIMIDGCTAHTGKVNVLVLEDEMVVPNGQ